MSEHNEFEALSKNLQIEVEALFKQIEHLKSEHAMVMQSIDSQRKLNRMAWEKQKSYEAEVAVLREGLGFMAEPGAVWAPQYPARVLESANKIKKQRESAGGLNA